MIRPPLALIVVVSDLFSGCALRPGPADSAATVTLPSTSRAAETGDVDYCFGSVGANCSMCWGDPRLPDDWVWCFVSVGSQLHDSCCSNDPRGSYCGADSSDGNCDEEWEHSIHDAV